MPLNTASVADEVARPQADAIPAPPTSERQPGESAPLILEDLLVEDVSIDGMCGVY